MRRFVFSLFTAAVASATVSAQTDSVALADLVVTGTRVVADVRHLPSTVTIIERPTLALAQQPSLLPSVMEQVPSLLVTSRGMMGYGVSGGAAGGISLRGLSGGAGQLLVLIDGHPQYNGIYGHPFSDAYPTMMAERVEVLRGPASMLYGSNAMAGVINIVSRQMNHDGVKTRLHLGAGSYGTFQSEVTNQLRRGRFSSTVSAQYGRSDNHRPRMGFEQYGGQMKLGYDFSEHWKAWIDANVTHFNASHPGTTGSPLFNADQWITRGEASAAIENHYDRTAGALSVFTNWGRHKIDDGTADPAAPTMRYFRSKDALTGISWYQSAQFFDGNRITAGIDYQHIYGNAYYTSKATGEVLDTPNKQSGRSYRNEIAGYVDFRQDLAAGKLTLDAGVRIDHHSVSGTEWIPQAGLVIRPNDTSEIKAMASKGFRNPTMREMYLYPPSNEELRPERVWNYELSWKHRAGRVHYGLNVFYIKGDNLIQTVAAQRKNMNTGAVENWGAEAEVTWHINTRWTLTSNHSVLHMEHPVLAAPEYKGYLGVRYSHSKWNLQAGMQHLAGLFTAEGDNEKKENVWLLHATAAYQLCRQLQLWVRGDNLLAQRYELNAGYPMPRATCMAGVNVTF